MTLKEQIKKLKEQVKKYKKISLIDQLTGLYNRRKLFKDLRRYSNIQKRFKIPFIIMMIDLDNFKEINDEKGHKFGDKYLRKVAKVLCKSIRGYENVYRLYEGDEFIIIFSHTKKTQILKKKVEKELNKNKIKASIGVCRLGKGCLTKVDREMYKDKGRDK